MEFYAVESNFVKCSKFHKYHDYQDNGFMGF